MGRIYYLVFCSLSDQLRFRNDGWIRWRLRKKREAYVGTRLCRIHDYISIRSDSRNQIYNLDD